jgi:hypothetical protein
MPDQSMAADRRPEQLRDQAVLQFLFDVRPQLLTVEEVTRGAARRSTRRGGTLATTPSPPLTGSSPAGRSTSRTTSCSSPTPPS